ncbi:MAG TPA: LysR family transcriptional regulator [Beijerinckiaceae bacterium]|nr:LysR family transcriptional regulator [Beijerinckiaceae bacterium]
MSQLSLRHFETLQAIVRQGTLVGAASYLNVTPAALTARLKALEDLVGLKLFDRTSGGMKLTMAGEMALDSAHRIEREAKDFLARMATIRRGQGGRLAVAAVSTAKYFAPRLIAAFTREHPNIDLRFLIGNRDDTIAALQSLSAEVALTGRPPADMPAEKAALGAHPYVIVAPPFHPLVGERAISKDRLGQETFLFREQGSGTRSIFDYFIGDITLHRAQVGIELGSNETIKQAVMAGLGVALISAHTIAAEVQDGRLRCLDVEGLPIIRQWFVVNRADREISPIAQAFRAFVTERGAHFLPRLIGGHRDERPLTVLPPEE